MVEVSASFLDKITRGLTRHFDFMALCIWAITHNERPETKDCRAVAPGMTTSPELEVLRSAFNWQMKLWDCDLRLGGFTPGSEVIQHVAVFWDE